MPQLSRVPRVCLVGLIAAGQSGVPRYAAALTQALDRVADEFPDLELALLTTPAGLERTRPRRLDTTVPRGLLARPRAGAGRVASEQILAARAAGDLLHFFDLTGPALARRRAFTTTVHDAAIRHRASRLGLAHKRLIQPWAARHAAATIAVSAFARDEAVREFDADPRHVHVVHSGPGLLPRPSAPSMDGERADPYVLYVGDLAEHKNLPFLVHAFERAAVSARLVLVGRRGEQFDAVRDAIDVSAAQGRIEIRGEASDEEIDSLYRGARALVLPSRYEGFGFTPLEAMARGCPVLASDIPAVREISGDGALLLPLGDENAWAGAIRRVLNDDRLRTELRQRGAETVARFSWDETARGVCAVFRAVLEPVGAAR